MLLNCSWTSWSRVFPTVGGVIRPQGAHFLFILEECSSVLACFYWNTSQSAPGSNCSFGESMSFIKIRANYKLASAVASYVGS